jgi:hypothetical protein
MLYTQPLRYSPLNRYVEGVIDIYYVSLCHGLGEILKKKLLQKCKKNKKNAPCLFKGLKDQIPIPKKTVKK